MVKKGILFLLLLLGALASSPSAQALQPPGGWTSTGPNSAALDPKNPLRGEVLVFQLGGGRGEIDELRLLLESRGLRLQAQAPDGGAWGLRFADRIGRARAKPIEGGVAWAVVLADPQQATGLDPDAILLAVLPGGPGWGGSTLAPVPQAPQPMAGGSDGSVWGGGSSSTPASTWNPGGSAAWVQDPAVIGVWEGTALLHSAPTRLLFRFGLAGDVVVEEQVRGETRRIEGRWATREGRLRLTVPGGGEDLAYQAAAGSLAFEYDGARISLRPAR